MKCHLILGLVFGVGAFACAPANDEAVSDPSASASTSTPTSTLATSQHRPSNLVTDATHVYWTTYAARGDRAPYDRRHDVFRVAKGGGRVETLATDQKDLVALTIDDEHVYWLARAAECSASAPTGVARRIAKSGGDVLDIATGLPCGSPSANTQAVVDAARLYWSGDDGVRAVDKAGGTPFLFAEAGPNPNASVTSTVLLEQDESTIFWGDSYGPLWAQPKTGAEKVKLLDRSPWRATVDATSLYFVRDGAVMRVAKEGGAPEAIGPAGGRGDQALANDDQFVYWTDVVDDTVRRLPKQGAALAETWVEGVRAYTLAVDTSATYLTAYGRERSGMVPEYVANSGSLLRRPR